MSEKSGRGGAPLQTIASGRCAGIYCAPDDEMVFGAELLKRTIENAPPGERRIRGLPL